MENDVVGKLWDCQRSDFQIKNKWTNEWFKVDSLDCYWLMPQASFQLVCCIPENDIGFMWQNKDLKKAHYNKKTNDFLNQRKQKVDSITYGEIYWLGTVLF